MIDLCKFLVHLRFLWENSKFVSSANKKNFSFEEQEQISLTYRRKRSGPSTEPCGTAQVILKESELKDSMIVV